jgi:hypothetical protein
VVILCIGRVRDITHRPWSPELRRTRNPQQHQAAALVPQRNHDGRRIHPSGATSTPNGLSCRLPYYGMKFPKSSSHAESSSYRYKGRRAAVNSTRSTFSVAGMSV